MTLSVPGPTGHLPSTLILIALFPNTPTPPHRKKVGKLDILAWNDSPQEQSLIMGTESGQFDEDADDGGEEEEDGVSADG